jgi:hypothetical protein
VLEPPHYLSLRSTNGSAREPSRSQWVLPQMPAYGATCAPCISNPSKVGSACDDHAQRDLLSVCFSLSCTPPTSMGHDIVCTVSHPGCHQLQAPQQWPTVMQGGGQTLWWLAGASSVVLTACIDTARRPILCLPFLHYDLTFRTHF